MSRLHKAINEYFDKASKSLEEWQTSPDYVPPIPHGKTYKDICKEQDIKFVEFTKNKGYYTAG